MEHHPARVTRGVPGKVVTNVTNVTPTCLTCNETW
jgi:hypothetical protein